MQIFRTLAGYSLGRADIVRRAMSKKKKDVMEREREIFIHGLTDEEGHVVVEGCVRRGVDEETARAIYGEMASFASYAFNKSHAAAYALLSYQTAWLKCHYPREYFAALLTSVLDNTNKLSSYIAECLRLGIRVLPPHVNESGVGFTVSGKDIRFGLLAVKNLGKSFISGLVREREENGKFTSFFSFCRRMYDGINRRMLESLIKCGSLDGLGLNRRQMLSGADSALDYLDQDKKQNLEGQIGFFSSAGGEEREDFNVKDMPDLSGTDKLAMEKEVTGMYLSGHPMASYLDRYEPLHASRIGEILEDVREEGGRWRDGDSVTVLAIITKVRLKVTKSSSTMAFVTVEDMFGSMEMLVFPKILSEYAALVVEGKILRIEGHVGVREEEEPKLICETLSEIPEKNASSGKNGGSANARRSGPAPGIYLRVASKDDPLYEKAKKYLAVFDGPTPLYIYFKDSGKLMLAPAAMRVDVNNVLLRELKKLLGEKNVAVVDNLQQ